MERDVRKDGRMRNPEHLRPVHANQPTILIAEDDVMVQNVARITLEQEGCFVLTADNGEDALLLSRTYPGRIDILLTDVIMPKMGGAELSKHAAAERPAMRIVFMSGYPFDEEIGPEHLLLQKPFGPKQLSDTIRALVPLRDQAEA
jgi:two-component system, cell cycle sensor histidine kinase and response regulator CckA